MQTGKQQSYTDYLAESTDTVRRGNSLEKVIETGVFLIVWTVCLVLRIFCFNPDRFEVAEIPHRFRTIAFFCVLPAATLIISALIGSGSGWSSRKWRMTLFFGGMFMLMQFCVCGVFRLVTTFAAGAAVSCIGIAAGRFCSRRKVPDKQ